MVSHLSNSSTSKPVVWSHISRCQKSIWIQSTHEQTNLINMAQLKFSDLLFFVALFTSCVLAQDRVPINSCNGKLIFIRSFWFLLVFISKLRNQILDAFYLCAVDEALNLTLSDRWPWIGSFLLNCIVLSIVPIYLWPRIRQNGRTEMFYLPRIFNKTFIYRGKETCGLEPTWCEWPIDLISFVELVFPRDSMLESRQQTR